MLKMNYALTPLFIILLSCGGNESKTEAPTAQTESNIPVKDEGNIGEVLATINGIAIGSNDYQKIASRTSPSDGKGLNTDEKRTVLNNMIEEELLFQEAYNRGLYRDPKVRKVMINALLREEVYSQVRNSDFSDAELQAYFDEHSGDFTIPEKVQFSRILIKVTSDRPDADAKAEADRIYTELKKNPAKFRETATKISEGPYRRRGGDKDRPNSRRHTFRDRLTSGHPFADILQRLVNDQNRIIDHRPNNTGMQTNRYPVFFICKFAPQHIFIIVCDEQCCSICANHLFCFFNFIRRILIISMDFHTIVRPIIKNCL